MTAFEKWWGLRNIQYDVRGPSQPPHVVKDIARRAYAAGRKKGLESFFPLWRPKNR